MSVATHALGTNSTVDVDGASISFSSSAVLGGKMSGTLTVADEIADTTNDDDAGMTSGKYGNRTINVSFTCRSDRAGDSAQQTLIDAKMAKTEAIWLRVRPRVGAGHKQFLFRVLIESAEYSMNNGESVTFNFSGRSNGGGSSNVVISTQT